MILTPEELLELIHSAEGDDYIAGLYIAQAQLRKMVEWGEEVCTEHSEVYARFRRKCDDCWQALRREAGMED